MMKLTKKLWMQGTFSTVQRSHRGAPAFCSCGLLVQGPIWSNGLYQGGKHSDFWMPRHNHTHAQLVKYCTHRRCSTQTWDWPIYIYNSFHKQPLHSHIGCYCCCGVCVCGGGGRELLNILLQPHFTMRINNGSILITEGYLSNLTIPIAEKKGKSQYWLVPLKFFSDNI